MSGLGNTHVGHPFRELDIGVCTSIKYGSFVTKLNQMRPFSILHRIDISVIRHSYFMSQSFGQYNSAYLVILVGILMETINFGTTSTTHYHPTTYYITTILILTMLTIRWNNLYSASPVDRAIAEQRIRAHYLRKNLEWFGVEIADVW